MYTYSDLLENAALEQLLDEVEFLSELKAQDQGTIDFITEGEHLEQIVSYVCGPPREESEERYASICCEVLSVDTPLIRQALFSKPHLLDKLFDVFKLEEPCNYVSKVIMALLRNDSGMLLSYMSKGDSIITHLISHISEDPVQDLLSKLVTVVEKEKDPWPAEWLRNENLIPHLINILTPTHSDDQQRNASQILRELIENSPQARVLDENKSPLWNDIDNESNLTLLFDLILNPNISPSNLDCGLQVIMKLLEMSAALLPYSTPLENLRPNIRVTIKYLEQLKHMLIQNESETLNTTFGQTKPFGSKRLRILDLLHRLVQLKYESVEIKLVETKIFTVCLDLFFSNFWNNFLHEKVEKIISVVLTGDCEALQMELLTNFNLIQRILDAVHQNEIELLHPKGIRRGYMGYIILLTSKIQQLALKNPKVKNILVSNSQWQDYIQNIYPEASKQKLGQGNNPDTDHFPDLSLDLPEDDQDPYPIPSWTLLNQNSFPLVPIDWCLIKNEEKLVEVTKSVVADRLKRRETAEKAYETMVNELDKLSEYKNRIWNLAQ